MKRVVRRVLLAPTLNRVLRTALAPLPRSRIPTPLWHRLPVVGDFAVELPGCQRFRYRSRGEYLGRVLYWRGVTAFEPGSADVVMRLAGTVNGFWDIGAYSGLYTLIAAAAAPGIDIVAFEPLPDNFEWLRSNLELNGLWSAEAVPAAVTEQDDMIVDLQVPTERWTSEATVMSQLYPSLRCWKLQVPTVSIDGLRQRRNGPPPGLIKIDAEGAESRILAGARQTLEDCRPIVLCEVLPHAAEALDSTQRLLRAASYHWGLVTAAGVVQRELFEPSREHRNQLLWPAERQAVLEAVGLLR